MQGRAREMSKGQRMARNGIQVDEGNVGGQLDASRVSLAMQVHMKGRRKFTDF